MNKSERRRRLDAHSAALVITLLPAPRGFLLL